MKCNRGLPLRVTLKGFPFAPTHGYSDKGFLRNRSKNVGVVGLLLALAGGFIGEDAAEDTDSQQAAEPEAIYCVDSCLHQYGGT